MLAGHRDARQRAGALREAIESEIRFFAVLERGQHAARERSMAELAEHELRGAITSAARPLLAVVESAPATAVGMRFGLRLSEHRLEHEAAMHAAAAAERRVEAARSEAFRAP